MPYRLTPPPSWFATLPDTLELARTKAVAVPGSCKSANGALIVMPPPKFAELPAISEPRIVIACALTCIPPPG